MKKIFSLFMMCVLAIGAAWAQVYTHTFATGELSDTPDPVSLSGVEWFQSYNWNTRYSYFGFDTQNGKGLQVGSSKKSCKGFILATTGIEGTITTVKVNASTANQAVATLEVTVGGKSLGVKDLTNASTDYTFESNGSGEIAIKYSQPETKKALYIKSIEITYTTSGTTKQNAGIAFETTSYEATLGEAFTAPALINPNNLTATYSSSNEDVATVDAATGAVTLVGAGTTTIKAETAETDNFYAGVASYTLTVSAPAVSEVNLNYTETFANDQGNFTIENKTALPDGMSYVWNHSTFNGTGFMKASAFFNHANNAVESWLISPTINLKNADGAVPETVELSFDQAINAYFGTIEAEAVVKIEADGDWTNLDITYPEKPAKGWTGFESNTIDLSQYAGKSVRIAFVYTSTENAAGGWEVNNFNVKGTWAPTGVDENVAAKTVSNVKYYNLAGVESNKPFDGVNIVKTTYSDGTTQTAKTLK